MLNLSLEKICESQGGIRSINVTHTENIDNNGAIVNQAHSYTIYFREDTARFNEAGQVGEGGDYYNTRLTAFVPRKTASMEFMVRALMNRKVTVFSTDNNGEQFVIYNARFSHDFDSGGQPGNNNGYTIRFTGVDTKKGYFILPTPGGGIINIGDTGGDNPGGGSFPTGNPGDPSSDNCCVIINPVQLAYVPGLTGNQNNRNEFVIASNGSRWFIDKDGRAIDFSTGGNLIETIPGSNQVVITPTFDISGFTPADLVINRNGVVLTEVATPTDINHYHKNGGNIELAPSWPLDPSEYIDIQKV